MTQRAAVKDRFNALDIEDWSVASIHLKTHQTLTIELWRLEIEAGFLPIFQLQFYRLADSKVFFDTEYGAGPVTASGSLGRIIQCQAFLDSPYFSNRVEELELRTGQKFANTCVHFELNCASSASDSISGHLDVIAADFDLHLIQTIPARFGSKT
jgi:hypothetical protein